MPSFRTPLIALSEGSNPPEKIQLFRTGTFYHESYGKFKITPAILQSMEKNFKDGVRGIDLALDYKHENEDVAAGWIKTLSLGDDGQSLWAEIDWTPRGKQVVADKEFRYVSPEFHPDYQDNESLKKFGPTLLGAGLTNRPTIKKMEPVMELQEYNENRLPQKPKEIKAMDALDPAKIDAMGPDELKALCKELLGKLQGAQAAEKTAAEKVACMEKEKALSEKKGVFAKMLSEGKVCPAQEEAFLKDDVAKFAELAKPMNKEGSGAGDNGAPTTTVASKEEAQKEVAKLAEAKVSEKKAANKGDAISMVLAERKDLREKIYA